MASKLRQRPLGSSGICPLSGIGRGNVDPCDAMRFIWTHVMHPQPIGPTSCAARLLDPNHALVSTMGRDAQVHKFAGTSE